MLTVIKPGTKAVLRLADGGRLKCWIDAVTINSNQSIRYSVVWWDNLSRNEAWVAPNEVEQMLDDNDLTIGFGV